MLIDGQHWRKSLIWLFGLGFAIASSACLFPALAWRQDSSTQRLATGNAQGKGSPDLSAASREMGIFFPFHRGGRRSYAYSQSTDEGSGSGAKVDEEKGHFSETIVSVDREFNNSVTIVKIERDGETPRYLPCTPGENLPGAPRSKTLIWQIMDRSRVFTACTQEETEKLAAILSKSPAGEVLGHGPDFILPFKVGATWGADAERAPRQDTFYEWAVESKEDVTVPAGKFKECFSIAYRTLPDHQIKWICPEIGLVAEEYIHHGTVDEHRIELLNYMSGPR